MVNTKTPSSRKTPLSLDKGPEEGRIALSPTRLFPDDRFLAEKLTARAWPLCAIGRCGPITREVPRYQEKQHSWLMRVMTGRNVRLARFKPLVKDTINIIDTGRRRTAALHLNFDLASIGEIDRLHRTKNAILIDSMISSSHWSLSASFQLGTNIIGKAGCQRNKQPILLMRPTGSRPRRRCRRPPCELPANRAATIRTPRQPPRRRSASRPLRRQKVSAR